MALQAEEIGRFAPSIVVAPRRKAAVHTLHQREAVHQQATVRELCHDLRGPAATIMAIAAAATIDGDLSPSARTMLSQIVDEAKRISGLCRDVLGVGGPESLVSVDALAASVTGRARLTADVSITLRGTSTVVHGNALALGRAISNLVDNAVRAAGPGGHVVVEVDQKDLVARIAVSDSGPGFGGSEQGSGGTGLGLRIAGRIVAEHGGELEVGQSGELGGASVVILLPGHLR